MPIILHITQEQAWSDVQAEGRYETPSLHSQGFIHCSTNEQVLEVANVLFKDQAGLVLLCIDRGKIVPEVRYENCEGGDRLFPHIYGPLNLDAVLDVVPFTADDDGLFQLPPTVRRMFE
ncbi:DUF952 domain-containing protein [Algisphaera agarilytica]|uniref:Uncharacterized protein (DUF952 family) n=1 Tax=Algisphaera agarilytica TaxID=1385975 RepID=A0A7X0H9F1_9BACT|nr:DUF952 domain-containing protein [Algisphaera agarilytica]MBB6430224.1 uncharacterized protein (DUF952 family) [Algisphaera agarilytica]